MITSQQTNGTTNVISFPKGLETFPFDSSPEEVSKIMNDELVSSPELNAELKRLTKTLLADRPVKSLAVMRAETLATTDPVKAAECAEDWAVSLLKELNDNPGFEFTPGVFAELKQIADFFRANQQHITENRTTKTDGTTNVISFPKGLERIQPEVFDDVRTEVAKIADPVEAVKWAKRASVILLGRCADYKDKEFTPEVIAEAEQVAELLLAGRPRKNAKGETIEMSVPEALALYDEQAKAELKAERQPLEHVSLSPPPVFPKVGLPLAITAFRPSGKKASKWWVTTVREGVLAPIADPVKAAECAKDWARSFMKDLYGEFKFTPEKIAEAKWVAEILLAGLPVAAAISARSMKEIKDPSSPPKKPNGAAPASNVVDNSGKYEPVTRDAPELAKLDNVWVTRIFDGDVDGKYQNDRNQLAFAAACELVRAGLDDDFIARVLMTTKCGMYVQEANPAYRLAGTLRRAHDFVIDPDLEKMNSKHAVLPIGDKTRVVTWDNDPDFPGRKIIVRAQSFADFRNLYSNKTKGGTWWLAQPQRRQYDGGQRFMPQHDTEVVGNVLNMFEGFPVQPRKPEGHSGAHGCQLFLDHGLKIMCSGNEEHWEYLLKREAWIAKYRRRSEIAAAYRTEAEGSGKGFWCNHLGHLYGPHYMQINKPEHVIGIHNPHLETLNKMCADEALFVRDPRHRNALFSLITEPTIMIDPKYITAYSAPNYLNIDMTTNSKHFVPASRTARRFFIPTVSENRVGDLEYFNAIEAQLKDGGYEALLYHLLYEVDLRDFNVRRVPKTAGLIEQVEYSRKGLDGLVEKICNDGCVPCAHLQWPGFSVSNGAEEREGFDYFIDNHHDRELRDLGALKVKRDLRKHWNCRSGDDTKRRDGSNMIYGVKWPPLTELRALFEERHGPQEWLHPEVTEWPIMKNSGFEAN